MLPIKVIVIDDDACVRSYVQAALMQTSKIACVGEASGYLTVKQLMPTLSLEILRELVVVLDVEFQGQQRDGAYIAEYLLRLYPQIKVLLLTVGISERKVEFFLKLGVKGVLLKDDQSRLVSAIQCVSNGKLFASSAYEYLLYAKENHLNIPLHAGLSYLAPKEKSVLELTYKKIPMTDIATGLNISIQSVYVYKSRAMKKLGIDNNFELIERLKYYFSRTTKQSYEGLPVFDKLEAVRIFNGNSRLAEECFKLLLSELPVFKKEMLEILQETDSRSLYQVAHRFYGGLCFTGAMRLRAVTLSLLDALRDDKQSVIQSLSSVLLIEIDQLADVLNAG